MSLRNASTGAQPRCLTDLANAVPWVVFFDGALFLSYHHIPKVCSGMPQTEAYGSGIMCRRALDCHA